MPNTMVVFRWLLKGGQGLHWTMDFSSAILGLTIYDSPAATPQAWLRAGLWNQRFNA